MKYVFVFAVFLVLLGLSSAASVSGRSFKNKLQSLQTARRENLLARRLQGLQRRDFGDGSDSNFPGGDSSEATDDFGNLDKKSIDEMVEACEFIYDIQKDQEMFEAIKAAMTETTISEFYEAEHMCDMMMMVGRMPFRRSLMEKLKTKAKK